VDELRLPVNEKLAPNEVNLAMKLIEGMTAEFDPGKYHDTYSEDVKKTDRRQGQGSEAPGAAAATCPQQRDRHRRGPAGEPVAPGLWRWRVAMRWESRNYRATLGEAWMPNLPGRDCLP
jgi:hypothetical protein